MAGLRCITGSLTGDSRTKIRKKSRKGIPREAEVPVLVQEECIASVVSKVLPITLTVLRVFCAEGKESTSRGCVSINIFRDTTWI